MEEFVPTTSITVEPHPDSVVDAEKEITVKQEATDMLAGASRPYVEIKAPEPYVAFPPPKDGCVMHTMQTFSLCDLAGSFAIGALAGAFLVYAFSGTQFIEVDA